MATTYNHEFSNKMVLALPGICLTHCYKYCEKVPRDPSTNVGHGLHKYKLDELISNGNRNNLKFAKRICLKILNARQRNIECQQIVSEYYAKISSKLANNINQCNKCKEEYILQHIIYIQLIQYVIIID